MALTARKRAAEEASRMVTVVRDSNDAITIQDFEGRITAWNHGAELMFGYSEQEALKMSIWQLAPPHKAAEQKDFNRRLFAGEKVTSFETQRLTKDGRLLEVWLTVTKLVDDAGKVIGVAATERDITARKREEEALRMSKERLLFATEGANLGIWNWDTVTGELIWSDRCKALFGIRPDETMSYQRFRDALHPDDRERTDMAVKDALDSHKDYDIEYRSLWPDGSIHWLAAKGRGYYDATGKAVRLEGVVLDITARKRAEATLRAKNEELERFNNAAVGRELRMVELKKQVNEFCRQMGKPLLYPLDLLSAESQASTAAKLSSAENRKAKPEQNRMQDHS